MPQSPRPPHSSRLAFQSTLPLLLLTAGLVPAGCSTAGSPLSRGTLRSDGAAGEPARELRRLDGVQARAGRVPESLPIALDISSLAPMTPAPEGAGGAGLSLAEAIERVGEPAAAEPVGGAAVDPSAAETALRHYVSGRVDIEAGRYAAAIEKLRVGVGLDPTSTALWEALGEAQLMAGLARPGAESLARAAALGSRNPATLLSLARSAQGQEDHAGAAGYLAKLAGSEEAAADPALGAVVNAGLGQSLIALGYLDAGVAALRAGLDLPQVFAHPTPYHEELGEVYRRRADLWRLAGDTLCRRSRYEEALEAYDTSAMFPSLDPAATLPRRIYAALRLGRPARAAIAIHEEVARPDGPMRLDARHIALIRELAHFDPKTGAALAGAIIEERDSRLPGLADSLGARLTRAAAAGLAPDRAAELLGSRLAENPLDTGTLSDLLALTPEGDAAAAARALADLVDRAPLHADEIAETVARAALGAGEGAAVSPAQLIAELERRRGTLGARLLLASLRSRGLGAMEPGTAAGVIEGLVGERPGDTAVDSLAVTVGARLGRWDLAQPALERLLADASTPAATRARALGAFQRFAPALEALDRTLEDGGRTPYLADLLLGAEYAAILGRTEAQERYLRRAIEVDPYSEAAYLPLLRLAMVGGGAADRQTLTDLVRRLREAAPSGRVLRLLRAEEFMAAGRTAQGQRELLALAEEDPFDPAPLRGLIAAWHRPRHDEPGSREQFAPAAAPLDALIESSPAAPWPVAARAALAGVLGDVGTIDRLAGGRSPGDDPPEAAGVIEDAMRRAGRVAEAEARAGTRLGSAPPNIRNTVELAALLSGRGELAAAETVLSERLPAGVVLTPEQAAPLLGAVEGATVDAARAGAGPAAALLDRVLGLVPSAPATLHALRIAYLIALPEPSIDGLLEAAGAAAAQHPDDAEAFYQMAAARLAQHDRGTALDFLARAVARAEPASPSLYRQWVLGAIEIGTGAEAVTAVRAAVEAGMTGFILVPDPEDPAAAEPPTPAELAYRLGVFIGAVGPDRVETGLALYELAIEYEPEHAWARNNLGYMLLEKEGPTDRAAEHIEAAYRLLPAEPSVIDTIGWLRYKQGVLADEKDDEGNVVRAGAVSLLFRAEQLAGEENPVITDHLGDAFWAQGDHRSAVGQWRLAEVQVRRKLEGSVRERGAGGEAARGLTRAETLRLQSFMRALRGKQGAAARGRPPAIAPIPGRRDPGPAEPIETLTPHHSARDA